MIICASTTPTKPSTITVWTSQSRPWENHSDSNSPGAQDGNKVGPVPEQILTTRSMLFVLLLILIPIVFCYQYNSTLVRLQYHLHDHPTDYDQNRLLAEYVNMK